MRNFLYYKTANCQGQPYLLLTGYNDPDYGFPDGAAGRPSAINGIYGRFLGKPRAASIATAIAGEQPTEHRFFHFGEPEAFRYLSFSSSNFGAPVCINQSDPASTPEEPFIPLYMNDPSITGLPNAPQTPYTIVDVQ